MKKENLYLIIAWFLLILISEILLLRTYYTSKIYDLEQNNIINYRNYLNYYGKYKISNDTLNADFGVSLDTITRQPYNYEISNITPLSDKCKKVTFKCER